MGRSRSPFIFALLIFVVSVGCNRNSVSSSMVRLSVSNSKAALSEKSISHSKPHSFSGGDDTTPSLLVVNITGTGITAPIFYSWNGDCNAGVCKNTFPNEVALTVPRGSNRLIQVLAVDPDGRIFRYGDLIHDVAAATENVSITLTPSAINTEHAHVMGRFLDSSVSNGPSGLLQGNFAPPNGAPLMLVVQSLIFSGWFNLVAFTNSALTYTFNGRTLFPNLNLNSIALNPPAAQPNIMRIHAPPYLHSGETTPDNAQTFVIGFFGSTSGQKACYSNADSTITGATLTGGGNLTYSGTAPLSGNLASTVLHVSGGTAYNAASMSACSTATTTLVDHLVFNEQALSYGHDLVAGFKGPWALFSDLSIVHVSAGSGPFTLVWNFLPDVTTGDAGIRGVTAFSRGLSLTGEFNADNGVACSRIADLGFSPTGSEVATQAGTTSYSLTMNTNPSTSKVVLCPFTIVNGSRVYPDAGAEVNAPGPIPPSAFRFVAVHTGVDSTSSTFKSSDHTQSTTTCKTYSLNFHNGTAPQSVSANTTVNVSFSNSNLSLMSSCASGTASTSLSFASGTSSASLYLSSTNGHDLNIVNFSAMYNGQLINSPAPIQVASSSAGVPSSISASFLASTPPLINGSCNPMIVSAKSTSFDPAAFTAPQAMSLSGVAANFYTDYQCSQTFNNVWPANETTLLLYMLTTAGSASESLIISAGAASTGTSPFTFGVSP